jgi:hypothetical protein
MLRLIKLLLVLSLASKRSFLTALTPMLLLFVLFERLAASTTTAAAVRQRAPEHVTRPPGSDVRSKPRVARAPGDSMPSLS